MHLPLFRFGKPDTKPVVLVILDGFGIAPDSEGNAITRASTPSIDKLYETYPYGELIASGESVGLPANEEGNTEVGHLNIGAGRTVDQDLIRINKSIEGGEFFDNKALNDVIDSAKFNNKNVHLVGLVSNANVHSSKKHLYGLLKLCGLKKINPFLHLFTDGRDSPPKEGKKIIAGVESELLSIKTGRIASISGRYYAMDRDRRWDRTEKAYKAIVLGRGEMSESATGVLEASYKRGETDEFVQPTVITESGKPTATIQDGDSVIFFNFRVDRMIQLTMALSLPDFEKIKSFEFGHREGERAEQSKVEFDSTFAREKYPKVHIVTFTKYHEKIPVEAVAFESQVIDNPMSVVFANNNLRQLHMAESEKEKFVTYYFNGLREEKEKGEDVLIIDSPKVETYDKKPEMSLAKLTKKLRSAITSGKYNFIVVNIANPDMVAHTGNIPATIKAIEAVDRAVGQVVADVLAADGTLVITADHGNAEEMRTLESDSFFYTSEKGDLNTDHSNNPVPVFVVNNRLKGTAKNLGKGTLADVAPTILSILNIEKPKEMTGRNLLESKG